MKIENAKLMAEFRKVKRCELCGAPANQVHHEDEAAGLETRITLARSCVDCHLNKRHGGTTGAEYKEKFIEAICKREKCSVEDRQSVVFLLKRAPKEADRAWFGNECRDWESVPYRLLCDTLTEAGR